ncbi:putative dehydrogenase [Asanoa ferruginea]|uniref:Putative dehydrogenase n=1 Tax=Asanoa ferruginea TaxID=53367 RepID=A0A3D9ZLL8_9ACTN|nr:Gfo/Idh/MocA family oxidoreductase [Asanoa ferruginea]REF98165.1 putative dehydrogenase [Asanoa ferruginea]GIF50867.1 oxidoreductase [Asanoa ferruginea]
MSGGLPRVALIGANGHGRWHRRRLAAGPFSFVGIAEPNPVDADPPVPAATPVFRDHRALLAATRPDVVIICTPPGTHLPIALDALEAGCDLLLEKPPVLSLADHARLATELASTGRVCQVGFQALGAAAFDELSAAIAGGALGTVTGVAAVASWHRDDAYYARSPWAGRRAVDGALINAQGHAVMEALALADLSLLCTPIGSTGRQTTRSQMGSKRADRIGSDPTRAAYRGAEQSLSTPPARPRLEVERYRTRPIESDDTAVLRLTLQGGLPVVVAVTLAGEEFIPGEVTVTGTRGSATLEYPTDRLRLPGEPGLREVSGRIDLLDNLLAHRADPTGVPLRAPLAATAGFTAVVEALGAAPVPVLLDDDLVDDLGAGPQRVRSIPGINDVLRRAADGLALPSELGVPWAEPPYTENSLQTTGSVARQE